LLRNCLSSIYNLTCGIEFEVFVVDNASSDGSQEMIKKEFPQVYFIENKENLGFARANNQAFKLARGRYLLLLNPDTKLIDNALKQMVDFMDNHPHIDAIGCKLLYPDGSLQKSCRHFPSVFTDLAETFYLSALFPKSPIFNYYLMGSWAHDSLREVDQPYGACLLFKEEIVKKVGLMDERFFMYYDEVDLCYRIKKTGGKIFFVPQIKIIHYANQSSNQVPLEAERWKYRSRLLFFEKHYGKISVIILTFNLIIKTVITLGIFPLSNLIFNYPRDISYFKRSLKLMWQEYYLFFRRHKK
ncbi:MAG: glycosyltransferase family 2 protein, partial [Candidatus Omnitrophica bacterium]|nr:glycosyltransferase family 2 protein [Candidatus Omnitrophota bacterium]